MNSPSSPALSHQAGRSFFRKIWGFLTQDIRSIKFEKAHQRDLKAQAASPNDPSAPVVQIGPASTATHSDADVKKIIDLQLRRSVLDWRDDFHFHVTETAMQSLAALTQHVENELRNMSKLRRYLFTKPAREVLKEQIDARVRLSFRMTAQVEQTKLRKLLPAWLPRGQAPVVVWLMWPKLEWDTNLSMKFTEANRADILEALRQLIVGERGLAATYRQWATQYAKQILELRNDQSDTI